MAVDLCGARGSADRPVLIGLFGIQSARTYLDVHPNVRLIVLESASTAGGVWSSGTASVVLSSAVC